MLTYSPPPLPYELLAVLGLCQPGACSAGPEGHLTGAISEGRRRAGQDDD